MGIVVVCWFGLILVMLVVFVLVGLFVLLGYWFGYNDCYYLCVGMFVNCGYVVVDWYFGLVWMNFEMLLVESD